MRLLIGGSPSKFFHLKEFGEKLKAKGHQYKLVKDTDILDFGVSPRIDGKLIKP